MCAIRLHYTAVTFNELLFLIGVRHRQILLFMSAADTACNLASQKGLPF